MLQTSVMRRNMADLISRITWNSRQLDGRTSKRSNRVFRVVLILNNDRQMKMSNTLTWKQTVFHVLTTTIEKACYGFQCPTAKPTKARNIFDIQL